ncbi:uncharacterized protein BXIN_1791 [Babesia sp. Xinjiang]|uniref:uncharacterized protein n=1 Tax=Babesia sp. Xinjiang TaxID=462227 RepID=UPI000A21DF35|nr:uncharacterized protein BXIN_1627 [Babesia sp. Xinjiang]XP_028871436.1 uncharacterized protein BXIN_1791 [Babesia sp. Xinjiang]ORM40860.1 hypothetical protein BXIN_1627 [Babesia sp. Xinjiang]ORM40980.1 hypothetical protein BXIN_1791 [Babesia sp. Xinjiang]
MDSEAPLTASEQDNLLANLSQLVSKSTEALQAFQQAAERSKQEIDKYKPLDLQNIKSDPVKTIHLEGNSIAKPKKNYKTDRFTQLKATEPVVSESIRILLMLSKTLKKLQPIVMMELEIFLKYDDKYIQITQLQEELYRMKRELHSIHRLDNIKNNAKVLTQEVQRLMTHKPDHTTIPEFLRKHRRVVESSGVLDCGCPG